MHRSKDVHESFLSFDAAVITDIDERLFPKEKRVPFTMLVRM
jgi:hypothetical protein